MQLYNVVLISENREHLDFSHRIAASPDDAIDMAKQAVEQRCPSLGSFKLLGMKALGNDLVKQWVRELGIEG